MKIIGCHYETTGAITFFCQDAWYHSMTVNNIGGAVDMSQRIPSMTWEQFKALETAHKEKLERAKEILDK